MYFSKYDRVGRVFQDTFKAIRIDNDVYLLWLSAYIHQNPRVAGRVENLLDCQWSSYPDYVGGRVGGLCDKNMILSQFSTPEDYRRFVQNTFDVIKVRKSIEHLMLD